MTVRTISLLATAKPVVEMMPPALHDANDREWQAYKEERPEVLMHAEDMVKWHAKQCEELNELLNDGYRLLTSAVAPAYDGSYIVLVLHKPDTFEVTPKGVEALEAARSGRETFWASVDQEVDDRLSRLLGKNGDDGNA